MRKSAKFSVSLPWEDFAAMETDRKSTGLGRSAFLRDALRRAKEQKRKDRRIRDYVAGYRQVPEDIEMAEAGAKAAAEIFEKEDWK